MAMAGCDVVPLGEMTPPAGNHAMQRTLDILPVFEAVNSFGFTLSFADFAAFNRRFDQNGARRDWFVSQSQSCEIFQSKSCRT
jgi:hypothetical protein